MRLATLCAVLTALSAALPATAQTGTYRVYASQADLDDGDVLAGAVPTCLAVVGAPDPSAAVLFFDRTSGQLAVHDLDAAPGARTTVVATAAALASVAGAAVTACRDAAPLTADPFNGIPTDTTFLAVTGADGLDRVLRLDPGGALVRLTDPQSPTDAGDGVTALVYTTSFEVPPTVFLARSRADGAPEDGFYRLDPDAPDQTPVVVATHPDLDLVGIMMYGSDPLAVSSSLGSGLYQNAVVSVPVSSGSSELFVLATPCSGDTPTFADCSGGLGDLVVDFVFDTDIVIPAPVVMNDSPAAPGGEALAALFRDEVLFTEAGLVAATTAEGYATPARGGYLARVPGYTFGTRSTLLLAGSDEGGATPGIYAVDGLMNVASEAPPGAIGPSVTVAPNPAWSSARVTVTVSAPSASAVVEVYDVLGRRVAVLHDGPLGADGLRRSVETEGWAPGVYRVRVSGAGHTTSTAFSVVR